MTKQPKYAGKVAKEGLRAVDEQGAGVFAISVAHDDWCDLLNNKGPCNCNPDVGKPRQVRKFNR